MLSFQIHPVEDTKIRPTGPPSPSNISRMIRELKVKIPLKSLEQLSSELIKTKNKLNAANLIFATNKTRNGSYTFKVFDTVSKDYEVTNSIKTQMKLRYGVDDATNAYLKQFELLVHFHKLIPISKADSSDITKFVYFDNAAFPGMFIRATQHFINIKRPEIDVFDWNASSYIVDDKLRSVDVNNIKNRKKFLNSQAVKGSTLLEDKFYMYENFRTRWMMDEKNNGDVTSLYNIEDFAKKMSRKVQLYTSDIGMEVKDHSKQEEEHINVNLGQVICGLVTLIEGGSMVTKQFGLFSSFTLLMIYKLKSCFKEVHICKPATSKPDNSEIYIVCIGYMSTEGKECILELKEMLQKNQTGDVSSVEDEMKRVKSTDVRFYDKIVESANAIYSRQISKLKENISYFKSFLTELIENDSLKLAIGDLFAEKTKDQVFIPYGKRDLFLKTAWWMKEIKKGQILYGTIEMQAAAWFFNMHMSCNPHPIPTNETLFVRIPADKRIPADYLVIEDSIWFSGMPRSGVEDIPMDQLKEQFMNAVITTNSILTLNSLRGKTIYHRTDLGLALCKLIGKLLFNCNLDKTIDNLNIRIKKDNWDDEKDDDEDIKLGKQWISEMKKLEARKSKESEESKEETKEPKRETKGTKMSPTLDVSELLQVKKSPPSNRKKTAHEYIEEDGYLVEDRYVLMEDESLPTEISFGTETIEDAEKRMVNEEKLYKLRQDNFEDIIKDLINKVEKEYNINLQTKNMVTRLHSYVTRDNQYELNNCIERMLIAVYEEIESDMNESQIEEAYTKFEKEITSPLKNGRAPLMSPEKGRELVKKIDLFVRYILEYLLEPVNLEEIDLEDGNNNVSLNRRTKIITYKTFSFDLSKLNTRKMNYLYSQLGDKKLHSLTAKNLKILENRYNLVRMLLKYDGISISGGQQWSAPDAFFDDLYNNWNLRFEAFASPLNSKLMERKDCKYFSLFKDIDAPFGSLGNIFNYTGSLEIDGKKRTIFFNPPFTEKLLFSGARCAIDMIVEGKTNMAIFIMPAWKDSEAYILLKKNAVFEKDLKRNTYYYQSPTGDIPAKFDSILFVLASDEIAGTKENIERMKLIDRYFKWPKETAESKKTPEKLLPMRIVPLRAVPGRIVPETKSVSETKITQLYQAAKDGRIDVIRELKTHLTLENIRSKDNLALRIASEYGHVDVLKELKKCGLTVEDLRSKNNFALQAAAENGHVEVLQEMKKWGLTTEDARSDDNFALRSAAENGHVDVLIELRNNWGLVAHDAQK